MSTGGYGTDGLFSDSRTLSGRQRELDAVRGLSVFLMVGAHVMNQFQPVSDGSGGGIIDFIATTVTGAFPGGANCFMMVMGMVMLFSTTATYRHFISRGLMLIVAGFGVEVIKLIPGLINLWLTGDFVSFYPEFPQGTQDQLIVITLFWQDILIFAGMAMVFLGIMQRLKVSNIGLLAIVAVMMIANEFLLGMHTGNDAVDIFCGYFWGTTVFDDAMTTSRYPFFSWILYPVAGYVLAEFMVRTTDKRRFYRNVGLWFLIAIIPLTAAGILTGFFSFEGTPGVAYQTRIIGTLWLTCAGALWIDLWYWIAEKAGDRVLSPLYRWSRNITWIYVLHFVVLSVMIQIVPAGLSIILCILVFLVVFAFVDALSELIVRKRKERRGARAC